MDNITHGLVGIASVWGATHPKINNALRLKSSFKSRPGLLAMIGILASNLGDLDVLIRSSNDLLLSTMAHRHFTHSFLFWPIGSAFCAWILCFIFKLKKNFLDFYKLCLIAYLTHILIDSATSYGTQIFQPLSSFRWALDWIAVVDIFMTIPLLVILVALFLKNKTKPERAGVWALVWCGFYFGLGAFQHSRALQAQQKLIKSRDQKVERVRVHPLIGSLFVWRAIYQSQDRLFADAIRIGLGRPQIIEGDSVFLAHPEDYPLTDVGHIDYQRVAWFSDGFVYWASQALLADARYSLKVEGFEPLWAFKLSTQDTEKSEPKHYGRNARGRMNDLWSLIWGKDSRLRVLE